jgi:hypothetical protein
MRWFHQKYSLFEATLTKYLAIHWYAACHEILDVAKNSWQVLSAHKSARITLKNKLLGYATKPVKCLTNLKYRYTTHNRTNRENGFGLSQLQYKDGVKNQWFDLSPIKLIIMQNKLVVLDYPKFCTGDGLNSTEPFNRRSSQLLYKEDTT